MSTLSTELRNKLERTIVQARDVAEAKAKAALEALAVQHYERYTATLSSRTWCVYL